jgi:hypothetical protein
MLFAPVYIGRGCAMHYTRRPKFLEDSTAFHLVHQIGGQQPRSINADRMAVIKPNYLAALLLGQRNKAGAKQPAGSGYENHF